MTVYTSSGSAPLFTSGKYMESEGLSVRYKKINVCAQYVGLTAEEQCPPGENITMCYQKSLKVGPIICAGIYTLVYHSLLCGHEAMTLESVSIQFNHSFLPLALSRIHPPPPHSTPTCRSAEGHRMVNGYRIR